MRRLILPLTCLLILCSETAAETVLRKGDMAIIGLNTPGEDFAFVLLADVEAGAQIFFSDNDVEAEGSDMLKGTEGVRKYTAPSNLAKGTVIRFTQAPSDFSVVEGNFALANTGDNLVCFQGYDPITNRVTRFLHAVGKRGKQARPAGLTEADVVLLDQDDGEYIGARTGPREDLFDEINLAWNWKISPDFAGALNDSSFLVEESAPIHDPNIHALASVAFGTLLPDEQSTRPLVVRNNGDPTTLTIHAATSIAGPDAARFSLDTPLPLEIPAGGAAILTLRFHPDGAIGSFRAALVIASNDPGDPATTVSLTGTGSGPPDYGRLIITEVISRPTEDECIEILCLGPSSAGPVLLSGVVLSDEDDSNTEGALVFPPGTAIAGGELILVAVGASDAEPTWLDRLPPDVRVFHEPARDITSWTIPAANPLIPMVDFPAASGGASGSVALSSADGVALYRPGVRFINGVGPSPLAACIDGMNYNNSVETTSNPINAGGGLDTTASRAGNFEAAAGNGFSRLHTGPNAASNATFAEQPASPGFCLFGGPASADPSWQLYP